MKTKRQRVISGFRITADCCRLEAGHQGSILISIISNGYIFPNRRITGSTYIRPCLYTNGNIIIAGYISARLGADGNIMLPIHILSGFVTNRHMRALRSQYITNHALSGTNTDRHRSAGCRAGLITDSNRTGTGCLTSIPNSNRIFSFCFRSLTNRYGIFSFGHSRSTGCQTVFAFSSRFFADRRCGFLTGLGTFADSNRTVTVFGNKSTVPDSCRIVRRHRLCRCSNRHTVVINYTIAAIILNNRSISQRNRRITTGIGFIPDRHTILAAADKYDRAVSIRCHTADSTVNCPMADGHAIYCIRNVSGSTPYRHGIFGFCFGLHPHCHRIIFGGSGLRPYRDSIRSGRRSIRSGRIGTEILNTRFRGIKSQVICQLL